MALYLIDYDLRKQRDYDDLYKAIEELGAFQLLESSWCFNHENTTPDKVRDYLMRYMDSDDGIMVAEIVNWACVGTFESPNDLP